MANDTKIGIYLCSGCDIGSSLDIEKLTEVAAGELKVPVCRTHDCLCSPDGMQMIQQDIANEGINGVGIVACSMREKQDVFTFSDTVLLDRINIREQVIWSQPAHEDETQKAAADYLRMGVAKLKVLRPVTPFQADITKTVLVVGGGIAGLTAAVETAKTGYDVVLVEKDGQLGGRMAVNSRSFPTAAPWTQMMDNPVEALIQEARNHPRITIHLNTTISKITGQPGQFDVSLKNGRDLDPIRIGAIVQASGWRPYDPAKLGHLGYGASPDVITNNQFEAMVNSGRVQRPSDNSAVNSVVFVQCAGSRDPNHLPYCSAVCCSATLKHTQYIRQHYPDANIYVIYKDVRTPGQSELYYMQAQADNKVFFTKGTISGVAVDDSGKLMVDVDETLIGDAISIKADLVVLATGMEPSTLVEASDEVVEAAPVETSGEKKASASAEKGAGILNLKYRLGTDLPTLKYGFPDSHYICFPYETRRTGIYAAGCVRAPQDAASSAADARGAALKAIQSLESAARGVAVHPRSGDSSYPEFFLQRCTQCKRCTEECPFGTLNEDAKGTPELNVLRCRRCGICMGACPERIISFQDYSIEMIAQMIKSIEMPDEFDELPRVMVFICENDAYPLLDMLGRKRVRIPSMFRFIPVRCLGSVNAVFIREALSFGYDGIMMLGCQHGDDYQCHYIHGSELAHTRMQNFQESLQQMALEPERVTIETISIADAEKLPTVLNTYVEQIEAIGLNPFKGM